MGGGKMLVVRCLNMTRVYKGYSSELFKLELLDSGSSACLFECYEFIKAEL